MNRLTTEQLAELAALPGPILRKRVKELQDKGFVPKFGQYAEAEGNLDTGALSSGFRSWDQSPYYKDKLKAKHRKGTSVSHTFDIPDIKKRSDVQRVESMAKRLFDTIEKNPWEADMILKGMAAEYWKAGKPISFDELKALAAPYIEKASKKAVSG